MTTRRVRSIYAPVGARCALCKLAASADGYGAVAIRIDHAPAGDPLAVFNKDRWLCDPCVAAIIEAEGSK